MELVSSGFEDEFVPESINPTTKNGFGAEGFGRWRLSGFYGYPGWNRRRESWQLLCSLLDKSTLPWIILGDFNDLLYASEKESCNSQP
uniref:Endonuclease/exonuclease/phosphatase domain-containing protein n=1 Tax=Manihot esculenta TaxID=3983 RepID=A0A2C9U919_MANES